MLGDIVGLAAGDRVPVDVRLINSADLRMLEAPPTGESVPVDKVLLAARRTRATLGHGSSPIYVGSFAIYAAFNDWLATLKDLSSGNCGTDLARRIT